MSKATTITFEQQQEARRAAEFEEDADLARHEFTLDGLAVAGASGVLCDTCSLPFEHGVHYTAPRNLERRAAREGVDEDMLAKAEELTHDEEQTANAEEADAEDGTAEETRSATRLGEWNYRRRTLEVCTRHVVAWCRACRFEQLRWKQIQQARKARGAWMKKPDVPFFVTETISVEVTGSIRRAEEAYAYRNPVSVAKDAEERQEARETVSIFRHDTEECRRVRQTMQAMLARLAPTYVQGPKRLEVIETFKPGERADIDLLTRKAAGVRWQGTQVRILSS